MTSNDVILTVTGTALILGTRRRYGSRSDE